MTREQLEKALKFHRQADAIAGHLFHGKGRGRTRTRMYRDLVDSLAALESVLHEVATQRKSYVEVTAEIVVPKGTCCSSPNCLEDATRYLDLGGPRHDLGPFCDDCGPHTSQKVQVGSTDDKRGKKSHETQA